MRSFQEKSSSLVFKKKIIQEVSDRDGEQDGREMAQGDELNKKHAQHIKMNAVQIKFT